MEVLMPKKKLRWRPTGRNRKKLGHVNITSNFDRFYIHKSPCFNIKNIALDHPKLGERSHKKIAI